jgi:hypothetical protein
MIAGMMTEFVYDSFFRVIMRTLIISIAVAVSLATGDGTFAGQAQPGSSSWLANLFQYSSASQLAQREAQLKTLMEIRSEQEGAWLDYLLARRDYARAVKEQRRQEMQEIASGNMGYGTTLSIPDTNSSSKALKLTLRQKYEDLYAILDDLQKALADRELTPSECGK